jgi:hypothetical protein
VKARNNAKPTHRYICGGGARQPVVGSRIALAKPPQFHIINKVILIGRLGQNAEAKIAQNSKEYVIFN